MDSLLNVGYEGSAAARKKSDFEKKRSRPKDGFASEDLFSRAESEKCVQALFEEDITGFDFGFSLLTPDKVYEFFTKTEQERETWIEMIQDNCGNIDFSLKKNKSNNGDNKKNISNLLKINSCGATDQDDYVPGKRLPGFDQ